MRIKVIGCGNAFSKKNFNQSFLVTENGRNLLIDCGQNINYALDYHGIKESEIHDIYVSHLHSDHVGNIENFAFTRYDWATKPTHWTESKSPVPRLIGNSELLKDLWDMTLQGGMKNSMEGFQATLETFFEVVPIKSNQKFEWQGWNIELIQQIHVMAGNVFMPTFGLFFTKDGHKSIYFTTDTQHCSPKQIEIFYKRADIIIQDCELIGVDTLLEEGAEFFIPTEESIGTIFPPNTIIQPMLWPKSEKNKLKLIQAGIEVKFWSRFKFGSGVHANFAQLAGYDSANSTKLSAEIKAKMWLSHYQDFKEDNKDFFGNDCDWDALALEEGFAGFVKLGQEFEV